MSQDKHSSLNSRELAQLETIIRLVENSISTDQAAIILGISRSQVWRLKKKYLEHGPAAFAHASRGKPKKGKLSPQTWKAIIQDYRENYEGCSLTQYCEFVREDFQVSISVETLRKKFLEAGICSPLAARKTRRKLAGSTPSRPDRHASKPRKKYMGEQIQMDASSLEWVPGLGQEWTLHLAIDSHSRRIVAAYFDLQETKFGYFQCLRQILLTYGIPAQFLTDNRTVFSASRKGEEGTTDFSRACQRLGIELVTTSDPRSKGQIERANQTLQNRLPYELKRAKIKSLTEANAFLPSYILRFNETVSATLNDNQSVFTGPLTEEQISLELSFRTARSINSGSFIRYENRRYVPLDEQGEKVYLPRGAQGFVCITLDGSMYFLRENQFYPLEELPEVEEHSAEFDPPRKKGRGGPNPKKAHKPSRENTFNRMPDYKKTK